MQHDLIGNLKLLMKEQVLKSTSKSALHDEVWRDFRPIVTHTQYRHQPLINLTPPLSIPSKMLIRFSLSRNSGLPTYLKRPKAHVKLALLVTSSCRMSTQPSPTFSSNYSPEEGTKELSPLLKSNGGKWALIDSGKGVERSFKFKTFKKTWVCRPNLHLEYR
jgi:hypothetical protein